MKIQKIEDELQIAKPVTAPEKPRTTAEAIHICN